eukprot:6162885-Karenia_brevis.AAC.1
MWKSILKISALSRALMRCGADGVTKSLRVYMLALKRSLRILRPPYRSIIYLLHMAGPLSKHGLCSSLANWTLMLIMAAPLPFSLLL